MKNSLYWLIDKCYDFMKSEFILFPRTSLSNENYYMLVPRNRDRSKISTEMGELTAIGYHITVYDQIRKDVKNSTFHITISLIDENKNSYVARIYYKDFGKYLFSTIKDREHNLVDIGPQDNLLKFGDDNIALFVTMILDLKKDYDERYQLLADGAIQLNGALSNITNPPLLRKKLLDYKKGLQDIISHIESGTLFNQEHSGELAIYKGFLSDTEHELREMEAKTSHRKEVQKAEKNSKVVTIKQTELSQVTKTSQPGLSVLADSEAIMAQSETVKETTRPGPSSQKSEGSKQKTKLVSTGVKINELNKELVAILGSKDIGVLEQVSREYELQNKKLALLENDSGTKSNKKSEGQLLDTVIRCNQLRKKINGMVLNAFNDETAYKKLDRQSMRSLLQQCDLKTEVLVKLAVESNRVQALQLLMQLRKDINLGIKTKEEKQYLLEIAYKKGHFEMFKFLLDHKVSPNILCTNKKPILFSACMDGRAKEMEALLEAKANPLALEPTGFAPLGALLMRTQKQLINIPMANVFLAYAPQAMDQLQGMKGGESTALAYACQENMADVAELLLRFGADPNKVRHDGHTPLGVCAYKDNFELFKYVVENSTVPIGEALSNALDFAVLFDKQHFIEYIMGYSEKHQLNLSVPMVDEATKRVEKQKHSYATVISTGTNITSFFFRSLYSDDSDDSDDENLPSIIIEMGK
ncbi:ankyrin repeat domain-containing protein [Legionella fallonii]|nr:ankyrin repeat domain-containing protein [Legionella fallonii]